jgi:hypothetical protein
VSKLTSSLLTTAADLAQGDPDGFLDTKQVCKFFGDMTSMSLHRWRHHPTPERRFPPPDMSIGSRNFWRRSAVLQYAKAQEEWSRQNPRTRRGASAAQPSQAEA